MAKVAIMITSCDAYSDCWKPMICSLDKCWPDCKYPRYIITNYKDIPLPNTEFIKIGDDKRSWCTLAKKGMDAIDCDYIIFFQEDYWLSRKVDSEAIEKHIEYMESNGVDYLKLCRDVLRDDKRIGDSDYCMNPLDIRYSFNTAMAIWRKSAIGELLIDGWSGWQFERQIIPYVKEHGIVLNSQCLHSSCIDEKGLTDVNRGAIIRSVWTQAAVDFLKENGMEDILEGREVLGPVNTWLYSRCPGKSGIGRLPFWGALKILKKFKLNW